jgi:hypothetical protein
MTTDALADRVDDVRALAAQERELRARLSSLRKRHAALMRRIRAESEDAWTMLQAELTP